MNDTKYKNGLIKEEIEIDDGINTTEVVWKQEDWNNLKQVNNAVNSNIVDSVVYYSNGKIKYKYKVFKTDTLCYIKYPAGVRFHRVAKE